MPGPKEWMIPGELAGVRVDQALAKGFPDSSRAALQELIRNGSAVVDGRKVKPSAKVKGGELVRITFPDIAPARDLEPTALTFPILFQDEHLVVIDKPYGLVVHPGAGREKESVVSALLGCTSLSPIGSPLRPGVIHRLDKTTSGVMVLARTEVAHLRLSKAFSARKVGKEYFALVQGIVRPESGRIEIAIERDRVFRKRMKAAPPGKGRNAVSRFERVELLKGATLLRVIIETGRTHQIRVHLAYIRHPLVGDITYGGKRIGAMQGLFLHSSRVSLTHPVTGELFTWKAPLPSRFQEALSELRRSPGR